MWFLKVTTIEMRMPDRPFLDAVVVVVVVVVKIASVLEARMLDQLLPGSEHARSANP